jgi:2,3-bisphosphoglycerate-dependent phosphoglycerate mutase
LQGLNKTETEHKYGESQVLVWRRSYEVAPPEGESLKDTFDRVIPFYKTAVEPNLREAKNVLIVAHGNSLRALMMHLDGYSSTEISEVNIVTGIPRVYEFTTALTLLNVHYLNT